jgi:hypothetical protein
MQRKSSGSPWAARRSTKARAIALGGGDGIRRRAHLMQIGPQFGELGARGVDGGAGIALRQLRRRAGVGIDRRAGRQFAQPIEKTARQARLLRF